MFEDVAVKDEFPELGEGISTTTGVTAQRDALKSAMVQEVASALSWG